LVDYVTMNISSPNTPGLRDLHGRDALADLLARTKAIWQASETTTPVFLKLAPDLDTDGLSAITDELGKSGAWLSGLIISNTTVSRPDFLRSTAKQEAGGLSGAPLARLSLQMLEHFAREFGDQFDLVACGGIDSGDAVYERIRAGAQAVQIYTALTYHGLDLISRINATLRMRLSRDGFQSLSDAVGVDLRPSS
ncbi:MAG: dihydroorotate dehydrogenase (quinone), partial [Pseudomonadota bacterium]